MVYNYKSYDLNLRSEVMAPIAIALRLVTDHLRKFPLYAPGQVTLPVWLSHGYSG